MATLDNLIDELRSDGAVESEGHFTLDREQARAKMQKFQLADARRYVLELVQAAVLRDASALTFEIDADDMRLRFDGQPFTEAEIDDLYGSLFGEGQGRAIEGVRQLALALNAALGMNPKFIHLRSGKVELRMRPGQPDAIEVHDEAIEGTQIHVKQRLRPRLFVDFFLNLTGQLGEEQYLRQRCRYAQVPITLDGKPISFGLEPIQGEPETAWLPYAGREYRGFMYLDLRPQDDFTTLHLVKSGVWIDSRTLAGSGTHIVAVIESDALRKDVSQAKIVSNEALGRLIECTRRARWTLWNKALANHAGALEEDLRARIRGQLLEHCTFTELVESEDALSLAEIPSWSDCRSLEHEYSLRALVDFVRGGGRLRWSQVVYPMLEPEDPPVLWITKKVEAVHLERVLDTELVEATELLQREKVRVEGRRAWLERTGEPVIPNHLECLAKHAFSFEDEQVELRGELAIDYETVLNPNHEHPVHILLYKESKLLGRLEVDLDVPNLWLVIEANFDPSDDYRDALRNRTFVHAMFRSLAAFYRPFTDTLAASEGQVHQARVRGMVKRWLIALLDPGMQGVTLTTLGVDVTPGHYFSTKDLLPELLDLRPPDDPEGPPRLVDLGLFRDVEDNPLSLRDLFAIIEREGTLGYLTSRVDDQRLELEGVPLLGPGDRKIAKAIFGEQRLEPYNLEPALRRLQHVDKPTYHIHHEILPQLGATGVHADEWYVYLAGSSAGIILPAYAGLGYDFDELEYDNLISTRVIVLHEMRVVCELELELGFGPLLVVIEDERLKPDALYEAIVRDADYQACIEDLRTYVDRLWAQLVRTYADESASARRWLARVLLHGAAWVAEHDGGERGRSLEGLTLVPTLSGRQLTFDQIRKIATDHGKVEVVDPDTGWAMTDEPELLKLDTGDLDALEVLLPLQYVDGAARVRHRRAYEVLKDRPRMTEAELDPRVVFGVRSIETDERKGEVGLSRRMSEAGLRLTLGTAGYVVQEFEGESPGFQVPIEAVVVDNDMPLSESGEPESGKYYRRLLRQIRRTTPSLILDLCDQWSSLVGDDQRVAWRVLCMLMAEEVNQDRSRVRDQAFEAALAIPGFRDLWGRTYSLGALRKRGTSRSLRALLSLRPEPPELGTNPMILLLDEFEQRCLSEGFGFEIEALDHKWEAELDWLASLKEAQPVVRPKIDDVALAYRKAQAAGGILCELWIPRDYSPLTPVGPPPSLSVEIEGYEAGTYSPLTTLPCAGVLSGPGIEMSRGELVLDDKEKGSLVRQVLILYLDLAAKFDELRGDDHSRAIEYMAWIDLCLEQGVTELEDIRGDRKRARQLITQASLLTPPSLRESLKRSLEPEPEPEPEAPVVEPEPSVEASPASEGAEPEPAAPVEPAAPAPVEHTPHERLLAAVYEQLHWARARHGDLLDELRLSGLALHYFDASRVCELRVSGVALNQGHPLVARLLRQDPFDLIDLSFLVAAVYTLMNDLAEEITNDHERDFVDQLAESLALISQKPA